MTDVPDLPLVWSAGWVMASATARGHLVAHQLASTLTLDASAHVLPGHVMLRGENLWPDHTVRPKAARRTVELTDRFVTFEDAWRSLHPVPVAS